MDTVRTRTRRPLTAEWDWQLKGACREHDPDLFYYQDFERGKARALRADLAKNICDDCPVREICRETAMAVGEEHGIWGGLTPEERRLLAHHRGLKALLGDSYRDELLEYRANGRVFRYLL